MVCVHGMQMLEMYADTSPGSLSSLRLVQFAGEAVRPDAVQKLANLMPSLVLQHLYGCTEHTSCISAFVVPSGEAGAMAIAATGGSRLPIGRPTTNVRYVLHPTTNRQRQVDVVISSHQAQRVLHPTPKYHGLPEAPFTNPPTRIGAGF